MISRNIVDDRDNDDRTKLTKYSWNIVITLERENGKRRISILKRRTFWRVLGNKTHSTLFLFLLYIRTESIKPTDMI